MAEATPAPQAAEPSPWNVPNGLTVLRILMVPLFAWMLLAHPHETLWRLATTGVFILAMITDLIDGHLARKHNLITRFGKLMDPIADKALTGMAFIGLSIIGELWWWVTILILVREWGITLLRVLVLKYGVISANKGGKLKTMLQSVALPLYLLALPSLLQPVAWVVMAAAFVVTIVTGVVYCRDAYRLRRDALRAGLGTA